MSSILIVCHDSASKTSARVHESPARRSVATRPARPWPHRPHPPPPARSPAERLPMRCCARSDSPRRFAAPLHARPRVRRAHSAVPMSARRSRAAMRRPRPQWFAAARSRRRADDSPRSVDTRAGGLRGDRTVCRVRRTARIGCDARRTRAIRVCSVAAADGRTEGARGSIKHTMRAVRVERL